MTSASSVWLPVTRLTRPLASSATSWWIAARELDSLPHELATTARLCAVLGTAFDHDELSALLERIDPGDPLFTPLDAGVALAELARHGVLACRGDRWRFRIEALQIGIYDQLGAAERARIHEVALAYWRTSRAAADRIAKHAAGAGLRADAARAYIDAGDAAHRAAEHVRADEEYTAALAHGDEPRLHEAALAGRGRTRWRIYRTC